jgi:hypothetical protein
MQYRPVYVRNIFCAISNVKGGGGQFTYREILRSFRVTIFVVQNNKD